jgi:hypothetical protein
MEIKISTKLKTCLQLPKYLTITHKLKTISVIKQTWIKFKTISLECNRWIAILFPHIQITNLKTLHFLIKMLNFKIRVNRVYFKMNNHKIKLAHHGLTKMRKWLGASLNFKTIFYKMHPKACKWTNQMLIRWSLN